MDEITLVGSRCGPFALALKLLEAGRVDVEGLVTHRFPLAQADEAVRVPPACVFVCTRARAHTHTHMYVMHA